jgi:hypothetical protein
VVERSVYKVDNCYYFGPAGPLDSYFYLFNEAEVHKKRINDRVLYTYEPVNKTSRLPTSEIHKSG